MSTASARLTVEQRAGIQGYITTGYSHLRSSAYLFLLFDNPAGACRWLRSTVPTISSSSEWTSKPMHAVNVAFTAAGLTRCGLPPRVMCTFPSEFQQDVATGERSRILGDVDESAPEHWDVGGPKNQFHAVLFVHATDESHLSAVLDGQSALIHESAGAVRELRHCRQHGTRPSHDREHFGFHDGISQPRIAGIDGSGVPTGEFILGYENHYAVIPPGPVVPAEMDPDRCLPELANPYHPGFRDLGRDGSFLVYRKLRQHVGAFWSFMRQEAARAGKPDDVEYMVWLASKCVGRWPSGAPLMLASERDDRHLADHDDFLFSSDPDGLRCPLGAHVRRSNPRDDIKPYGPAESLSMSGAHRVLRRGRSFGPSLFDPVVLDDPTGVEARRIVLGLQEDDVPRGVHFFCVNASIRSQFEFIQQTWCNNPRFGGLRDNKDPVVGDQGTNKQPASVMTIPQKTGLLRSSPLHRFVTVSGGAYLFMPSLHALRFLGGLHRPGRLKAAPTTGGLHS